MIHRITMNELIECIDNPDSVKETVQSDYKELEIYLKEQHIEDDVLDIKIRDLILQCELVGYIEGFRNASKLARLLK